MIQQHLDLAVTIFTKMEFLLPEQGYVPPMYFLILENSKVLPIIIRKESIELSIGDYANIAVSQASEMDAQAIMFISEQYMVSKKKGDINYDHLINGLFRPSQDPERQEYLTLVYMHESGLCKTLLSKIHTDLKGTRYTKDKKWIDKSITNLIMPWK